MKSTLYILIGVLLPTLLFSQTKVNDNWYFGKNAGITFGNGTPTALTNSLINQLEGNSSISDTEGRLLFYTDGITVWNKNHTIMDNGTDLSGQDIAAQSALIVPLPNSSTIYYIFTIQDWQNTLGALRYSTVDISRNGGNGEVILKNVLVNNNASEQIAATFAENCTDIWIVSHEKNNNKFVAYRLNQSGLQTTPITSTIGMTYSGTNRFGYLKFSQTGSKLCSTFGGTNISTETVELYDFNRTTGIVSNSINIATNNSITDAYSSEFSADGTKLYVTAFNGTFINQYDISSGIQANILASKINIANSTSIKSSLQIGQDNKIYVSKNASTFLGVISSPNSIGLSSNYIDNGVSLGDKMANLGLPNLIIRNSCKPSSNKELKSALNDKIQIYPNPTSEKINIEFSNPERYTTYTIKIADIFGRNVLVKEIIENKQTLDISTLPKGLYMLIVETKDGKQGVKKVFKN